METQKLNDPFRTLFETNPLPMWIFDAETFKFLEVNEAAIKEYGYSREEFLRLTVLDIRPEEDVECLRLTFDSLSKDPALVRYGEWRHRRRDGSILYAEVCSQPIFYDGHAARLSMMMDVTQRKMTEDALRRSEAQLNEAQEVAGLGSWEWNIAANTSFFSDELYRIYGFPPQGATLDNDLVVNMAYPDDRERVRELLKDVATNPRNFHMTFRIIWPDGSVRQLHMQGEVTFDADGKPVKMAGTVQDITERIRAEEERIRNARLQTANKELEAFSYSVSHDLRTPLRSIDAFAKLLSEEYGPTLDETGRSYVDLILTGTRRMNELIDDLIEFSRVTSTRLDRGELDLSELVQTIVHDRQRIHPERSVEWHIAPGLKAHGDRRLMRIALENLLGNAWKFTGKTEAARIDFGVLQQGNETVFFVRDNGAGFDMEFADKLFGVFQRLHSEREFAGTGIGLAIVQRIIARHGGRVWAQAAVGKGATFYFTLPG